MKKILYIAYHFPPIGGGGVQRNSKFVRHLREFGYEPIVLTGPGRTDYRWTPDDQTLLADVPEGVEVARLPGPEPNRASGWRGRAERWLDLQSSWGRWWTEEAVRAGKAVGRDVDLVYVSLVPYTMASSGVELARSLGKPLIFDLQDPWALDEMWIYPTRYHRDLDIRRMRRALVSADGIVMNTPGSARLVLDRFPELRQKHVVSISNGFDAEDFAAPTTARSDDRFRIVHSGYLHTDLGIRLRRTGRVRRVFGGVTEGVDILTRSHVFLLEAVARLIARRPELRGRVEVHLLGVLNDVDRAAAAPYEFVRLHGYVPHPETIDLISSADLLFLPMHNVPADHRIPIVPGKTYEYLASGRPILGAVPRGDARDLLAEAGSARLCEPDDVAAMEQIVAEELERAEAGQPAPAPNPSVLARFERRKLTADLAASFDAVLEGAPRRAAEAA